jgi:hypothetical protein
MSKGEEEEDEEKSEDASNCPSMHGSGLPHGRRGKSF